MTRNEMILKELERIKTMDEMEEIDKEHLNDFYKAQKRIEEKKEKNESIQILSDLSMIIFMI